MKLIPCRALPPVVSKGIRRAPANDACNPNPIVTATVTRVRQARGANFRRYKIKLNRGLIKR